MTTDLFIKQFYFAPYAAIILNASGKIELSNLQAEKLTGFKEADIKKQSLSVILGNPLSDYVDGTFRIFSA